MSSGTYYKTKFEGVFYRESTKLDPRTGARDRIYYYWYADAAGKGHWKSVGRHSEGLRPQTARQARMDFLSAFSKGTNLITQEGYTIGEAVDSYVEWASAEGKHIAKPLQQYDKHLRSRLHAVPISAVTTSLLMAIKAELGKVQAPQSVHHHFSFLRRVINHAVTCNVWTGANPVSSRAGGWRMPKVDNGRLRYFSPAEARLLLEELKKRSQQLHDMALLSLRTGMRATEIFKLRGQDIDARSGLLHYIAKGGGREQVHVPDDIIAMLLSYGRKPHEFLFQERGTGLPIKRISDTFERALTSIGLQSKGGDSHYHITFHTLRHTFASWLAQSGQVTLLELKALMHHKSLSMTQRYAHLIPGQERAKLCIINNFLDDTHN